MKPLIKFAQYFVLIVNTIRAGYSVKYWVYSGFQKKYRDYLVKAKKLKFCDADLIAKRTVVFVDGEQQMDDKDRKLYMGYMLGGFAELDDMFGNEEE